MKISDIKISTTFFAVQAKTLHEKIRWLAKMYLKDCLMLYRERFYTVTNVARV